MTDDLVKQLRQQADSEYIHALFEQAADRIEKLEKSLINIWGWYPTSVSNPYKTINDIKDYAFRTIKELDEDAKSD
jgi:hypothetical protein